MQSSSVIVKRMREEIVGFACGFGLAREEVRVLRRMLKDWYAACEGCVPQLCDCLALRMEELHALNLINEGIVRAKQDESAESGQQFQKRVLQSLGGEADAAVPLLGDKEPWNLRDALRVLLQSAYERTVRPVLAQYPRIQEMLCSFYDDELSKQRNPNRVMVPKIAELDTVIAMPGSSQSPFRNLGLQELLRDCPHKGSAVAA